MAYTRAIRISHSARLSHSGVTDTKQAQQYTLSQTTPGKDAHTILVSNSEEDMPVSGDIVAQGFLMLQHVDPANSGITVTWGAKSAGAMVATGVLKYGDPPTMLRLQSTAVIRYLASAAGPVRIEKTLYDT